MADLKNTNIDDNLELPQGTTGERPSSPQEGQIRYNTDLGTTEFYNGANWRPLSDTNPEATGGTVVDTDIGGVPYRIHAFTNVGTDTFTVTNPGSVDVLVVGGGGSGGSNDCGYAAGGGGGGGGIVFDQQRFVSADNFSVVVGAGGENNTANTGSYSNWESGQSSFFDSLEAFGGGKGGSGCSPTRAAPPGTYGGGGGGGTFGLGSDGTPGQGNDGGDSSEENGTSPAGFDGRTAGGGGPALSANGGTDNRPGGIGGNYSAEFGNFFGENGIFAGGGGGGSDVDAKNDVPGGLGGGGEGRGDGQDGGDAINGTGGGGGGSSGDVNTIGGNGGSGIVIVRYPRNSTTTTQPDRTVVATQPNRFQTVQDGLSTFYDAGNPVSYPGTGDTWYDLTGNSVGTLIASPEFRNEYSGYFEFTDTTNQGVLLTNNPNLNVQEFSIHAWVRTNRFNQQGFIFEKGEVNTQFALFFENANITFRIAGSSDLDLDVNTESVLNLKTWHLLTATYRSGERRLYVDGELVGSDSPTVTVATNNELMSIGRWARADGDNDYNLDGDIGEVLVYNKRLSETEVKQNFNATRYRYGA